MTPVHLTLNAGSSSIKFAAFAAQASGRALARGQVESIGANPRFRVRHGEAGEQSAQLSRGDSHAAALGQILGWIEDAMPDVTVAAVGHRVVHGGTEFREPVVLDAAIIAHLQKFVPLAPLHQPHNLAGIAAAEELFPGTPQIACFDTSFHRAHPFVNDTFALPRAFYDEGVRRYGFHGLSYEYLTRAMAGVAPDRAAGSVVYAHLGNGASMCAVLDGRSIGSTMGFSALDGLPMGTRCGQLDPGVVLYLMSEKGMDAAAISDLLYRQSGLKGLSEIGSDMRVLEASDSPRAAEAIDYFVFRIRRELGAMAAVLNGIDALVFAGGIGENSALIRGRVCADQAWLGLTLDPARNAAGGPVISAEASDVEARVIHTDEEGMIARHMAALLGA